MRIFCEFLYFFYSSGNGRKVLVGYPCSCLCISLYFPLVVLFPLAIPSIVSVGLVVDFERKVDMLGTLYDFFLEN